MEKNKLSWMPPVSRSIFSIMFPQPQKTMRTNIIERQDAGHRRSPHSSPSQYRTGADKIWHSKVAVQSFTQDIHFKANIVQCKKTQMLVMNIPNLPSLGFSLSATAPKTREQAIENYRLLLKKKRDLTRRKGVLQVLFCTVLLL